MSLRPSNEANIVPQQKPSGYEGLHFVCEFDLNYELGGDSKLFDSDEYYTIPFEIQIRTYMHHLWSDLEHKAVYRKIKSYDGNNEIAENEKYLNHKLQNKIHTFNLALLTATRLQKEILNTHHYSYQLPKSDNAPESYAMAERLNFFDQISDKIIIQKLNEINNDLREGVISKHLERINFLYAEYQKIDINPLTLNPANLIEWGKQRIFLMLLAYFMAFRNIDDSIRDWHYEKTKQKKKDSLALAITIYKNIIFYDKKWRSNSNEIQNENINILYDLTAHMRLASAFYFQSKFRFSISAIEEALLGGDSEKFIEQCSSKLQISKAYRRLGEYYWYVYHKEFAVKSTDLDFSIKYYRKSLDCTEKGQIEYFKAFSRLVCSLYYKYCIKSHKFSNDLFENDIKSLSYSDSDFDSDKVYIKTAKLILSVMIWKRSDKNQLTEELGSLKNKTREMGYKFHAEVITLEEKIIMEVENSLYRTIEYNDK